MTYQPNPTHSQTEQIAGLIEYLSAYIVQYHNGFARFICYQDDVLTVEMGGRCADCTLSTTTLRGWIEGTVRQFFPDIGAVVGIAADTGEAIAG
ncbi:MAG: NifU family protein [Anaerolineae bacterium]